MFAQRLHTSWPRPRATFSRSVYSGSGFSVVHFGGDAKIQLMWVPLQDSGYRCAIARVTWDSKKTYTDIWMGNKYPRIPNLLPVSLFRTSVKDTKFSKDNIPYCSYPSVFISLWQVSAYCLTSNPCYQHNSISTSTHQSPFYLSLSWILGKNVFFPPKKLTFLTPPLQA